jgi:NAD(P)-dependent dehydrogenase (short-subunit alcohol dehydrogenase family)
LGSARLRAPAAIDLLAYSAAKRAGVSIVESFAATLGPYNIRVNAVAPGFANTSEPARREPTNSVKGNSLAP